MCKICINCKIEFIPKPNTRGKYCSLQCSADDRKKQKLPDSKTKILYDANPKSCKQCNHQIPYEKRTNKFCSNSCKATFVNKNRTVKRKDPKLLNYAKGNKNPRYNNFCIFSICIICNLIIPNKRVKTCSQVCKSKHLSLILRGKTGGSTKQFIRYFDSFNNEVSLDSSWELKIANELDKNNIKWSRPKAFLLSNGRKYTPDFYLEDYGIYIDPKAYRKGYIKNVEKIKQFELEFNTKCLIISEYKSLTWEFIKSLL